MAVKDGMFNLRVETRNFNRHIKQFKRRSDLATSVILKKFAFDLLKKIITKNPVDTGRSRAGWYVAMEQLGGKDWFVARKTKPRRVSSGDPKGYSESEVSIGKRLGSYKEKLTGAVKWIELVNGVDYIIYLEYGYSLQAPYGMVRLSMREIGKGKLPKDLGKEYQKEWNKFYTGF